jgi:cytochrome c
MITPSHILPVSRFMLGLSAGLVPALAGLPAAADGNAEGGRRVFQACASCHAATAGTNGFGPALKGVVGRKAGSFPGYRYSEAMRKAGEDGLVWDEAALAQFLSSPKKKVPGTSMRFFGLWFQSEIDDVIAYLKANP